MSAATWSEEALRIAFQLGAYLAAEELEDPSIADGWCSLVGCDGAVNAAHDDWSALTYEIAGHLRASLPNYDHD